jgi:hypothetical protein
MLKSVVLYYMRMIMLTCEFHGVGAITSTLNSAASGDRRVPTVPIGRG